MAQCESDMKDLKHALQAQHSDLQHRHHQLQVPLCTFLLTSLSTQKCLCHCSSKLPVRASHLLVRPATSQHARPH